MYSRRDFLKLSILVYSAFQTPFGLKNSSILADSRIPGSNSSDSTSSNKTSGKKAIVIGAGVSGLACAKKLRDNGWEVEVLESRNRVGGRIHTYRGWGYPMDLGASWIHGIDNNPIYKIAREERLDLHLTDYKNSIFYKNGKPLSYWTMLRALWNYSSVMEEMEKFALRQSEDLSLRDVYSRIIASKNYPADRMEVVQWLYHWMENDIAEDGDKISARSIFEMDEGFTGDEVIFKNGYEGIIQYLARDLDIKTGIPVGRIQQTSTGVSVETNRSRYQGDIVVVTVPLGVLQKGTIRFQPDLPTKKMGSLSRLGMGILNKLYLEFDDSFWDKKKHFIGISEEKHFFDGFINLHPFFDKPAMIGFTHGSRARSLENMKESELKSLVSRSFGYAFGRKIPEPKRVFPTRWDRDPFSYGSYSFIPLGGSIQDIRELSKPVGRIHFAGEHTSSEYFGYVHGAFLSGIREAEQLIANTVSR